MGRRRANTSTRAARSTQAGKDRAAESHPAPPAVVSLPLGPARRRPWLLALAVFLEVAWLAVLLWMALAG